MSGYQVVERLRDAAPMIMPSLLNCDFGNLEREVAQLEDAGVEALHLDIMDGHFVPNLSFGLPVVEALNRLTDMALDVHLMISNPEEYVEKFAEAGADLITFHVEADAKPRELLERIHGLGIAAGLAVNPATPLNTVEECLDECDLALVMSVPAGFGGQTFREGSLDRLQRLRDLGGDRVLLQVDGGVNRETISRCTRAGADLLVVGSAIFRCEQYGPIIRELSELAEIG
jgi:ribulose-phosphate 3-epimerase